MRNVKQWWGYLLPLLLFISLQHNYTQAIPPFEGPDEAEHIAYLFWLVEERQFPPQGAAAWQTPVRQEAGQPPLYYGLAALPTAVANLTTPPAIYRPNPYFPSAAPGHIPDNKNIAIHYPTDTDPLEGQWRGIYAARFVSLGFGLLLIVSSMGLMGQLLVGRKTLAIATGLLVATTPQIIFLSSVVSNDVAVAALSTLTLWLLARLVRRGLRWQDGLWLGVAAGLALLAKSSALLLGLPIALGLGWLSYQQRTQRRAVLATWTAVGTAVLLIAGWWYVRAFILYGSPLGTDVHCYAAWAYCDQAITRHIGAEWVEVIQSYWVGFGWGNIKFQGWVYQLLIVTLLIAGLGWLGRLRHWWHNGRYATPTVILFLLLLITTLATAVSLEFWMRAVTAPHGRLLYPAIGAISVITLSGWHYLPYLRRPSAQNGRWPPLELIPVGGMILLAIVALPTLLRPAYAPPQPLSEAQLSALGDPLNWQFGELAQLLAVEPQRNSAQAGETLPIQLCWRPLSQSATEYAILLHLIGRNEQVVASRHTYPGLGRYPTSVWQVDAPFCDQIGVPIPADLAETQLYQVEVGWLDPQTGQRLPAYDRHGQPLEATFATAVRLATADPPLTPPPSGDDPIQLYNATVAPQWPSGQPTQLTLHWYLHQAVSADYTIFIHLQDPHTGELVATFDAPPKAGWYPTSWWQVGELVIDQHTITPADDLPPGRYDLLVGLYDPQTGQRLGDAHPLNPIEILP